MQTSGKDTQSTSQAKKKDDRTKIYIIGAIVVIAAIAILFIGTGGSGTSTTTLVPQTNATPIYMNASQAEQLLGSPIINYSENYTATSIYNYTFPLNVSVLESFVPALSGNVTNGWVTAALGSGANNATMEYFVIQTANASNISELFAQGFSLTFPTLPNTTTGDANGMNYTYETYTNSSIGSFQILVGWKDGYVALLYLQSNNPVSNQTDIAQIVSGNIQ